MKPRLISFNLCPFVQRAAIVLAYKDIDHDIDFIELSEPPEWFLSISPLKKVPVLTVGDNIIFDSSVISEFLDEAYPGRLHPEDVFLRAMNRSWIEYGNQCMFDAYYLTVSQSVDEFHTTRDTLWDHFDRIEKVVQAEPFFNGPDFSLVDSAYAPMFQRLDFIEDLGQEVYDTERHPKIVKWKKYLSEQDSVQRSAVPDLQNVFHKFIKKEKSYFSNFL